MISAIIGVISTLVGWLTSHLPTSPFANLSFGDPDFAGGHTLREVLGWVNWLVPFRGMQMIFSAWLTTVMAVSVVIIAKKLFMKVGTNGVLGGDAQ